MATTSSLRLAIPKQETRGANELRKQDTRRLFADPERATRFQVMGDGGLLEEHRNEAVIVGHPDALSERPHKERDGILPSDVRDQLTSFKANLRRSSD